MAVLRSGEPDWSAAIPDSLLNGLAQDEEHLRIIRELGLKSYIYVPFRSRTKTLGVLTADPIRLAQVLLNLLNNAAKYTEQGGRIWLTAEREGEQVVLRVKDTGIGIPQDMLPRLFEMFTQVDDSLERSQGGLGIGLTLVRSLVELHGGTVEVHSDGPGKSSEFVVRLPVAMEVEGRAGQGTAGGEAAAAPARCRILVVDDIGQQLPLRSTRSSRTYRAIRL
jgi:signal transduction histidine kinase